MIEWQNLLFNSLWILALAIALAAVSWSSWQASERSTGLRAELAEPGPQRVLHFAGFLFALSMALTAATGFERALWFLGGAYFLIQIAASLARPDLKDF